MENMLTTFEFWVGFICGIGFIYVIAILATGRHNKKKGERNDKRTI